MPFTQLIIRAAASCGLTLCCMASAFANGPVYQPPGANLTLGDVTHGRRVQSASTNPAAGAADLARNEGQRRGGTVFSIAAGLEYGNLQNIFDLYDEITAAYEPSPPEVDPNAPGQLPELKPPFDLGNIWDSLDPEYKETLDALGKEISTQLALLAVIKVEGYARAWVSADLPFLLGKKFLGGSWSFGVNWSGSSKAFGLVRPLSYDRDEAVERIDEWFRNNPSNLPARIPVSDEVNLIVVPDTNAVFFNIANDSSIITKATQTTELDVGYSTDVWGSSQGTLFLGAEARLYLMRLSRLSVRFGDITDSEELFDAIRNNKFRDSERIGIDIGALWVSENFQVGAQVTNVNEPSFSFPDVNISPYSDLEVIAFLERDKIYTMDRQLKIEASLFSKNRRWSAHLGYDVDPVTDPLGDRYQWGTLSVDYSIDSRWIPNVRLGFRKNLAGTQIGYWGAGATLFRHFNIDLSSAFETTRIDGQELPQGLMLSMGFHVNW